MKTFDDSNWREEYKSYTSNRMELDLLEQGPKSLSQSWHLQALYSELCWDHDDVIEFTPDYENDRIIIKRKNYE